MVDITKAKEIFFLVGSVAGILAFFRPVIESKYASDRKKIENILTFIPEQGVKDLDYCIWQIRRVDSHVFNNLEMISTHYEEQSNDVRFNGPLKHYITTELKNISNLYRELRKYIQAPYWELQYFGDEDNPEITWVFQKKEFKFSGGHSDYDTHLKNAAKCAGRIRDCIRRLEVLHEMHFMETLIPSVILPKRLSSVELET